MNCINVNVIESEDNDKKLSVESMGNREYELCLKNALKEALDENEKVRKIFTNFIQMKEQIIKMEKEIEQLKIENKEKEDALIELSQFYYVRINIFIIDNYFFYSIIKINIKMNQ